MSNVKRVFLAAGLAAFAQLSPAALKIVTTTPDLASIASAVGGKHVSVSALLVGARDPHRVEAKPSYMSRVARADLFLAIGLDLETGYESAIIEGSRNSKVRLEGPGHVHVSDWTYVLDKPTGPITRAMGDIHPHGNPHIWLDPWNGRTIALKLAEKFAVMDAKNAKDYRTNAAQFCERLDTAMFGKPLVDRFGGDKLWQWQRSGELGKQLTANSATRQLGGWMAAMQPHAGKPIITYHRSYGYFTHRFGLEVVMELEPKPGLEPSPGHLSEVLRTARSRGVKAILQESFYSVRHAQFVASRVGGKVVSIPQNVGHVPEARDYISLFDVIVSKVSEALR